MWRHCCFGNDWLAAFIKSKASILLHLGSGITLLGSIRFVASSVAVGVISILNTQRMGRWLESLSMDVFDSHNIIVA